MYRSTILVNWLIEKGTELGFVSTSDYVDLTEGISADVAWNIDGRKPVVTFICLEDDSEGLLSEAIRWVGSSTEPKVWRHYVVCLDSLPSTLDVSLPSNVVVLSVEDSGFSKLGQDLQDLSNEVWKLLRIYSKENGSSKLQPTVKSLSSSIRDWPLGISEKRISYEVKLSEAHHLNTFYNEIEANKKKESGLIPSRNVIPLDIIIGDFTFEGALLRLVSSNDGILYFSTEHRNLPFTIGFKITRDSGFLYFWFDPDKSNVVQALIYSNMVNNYIAMGLARFVGFEGEIISFQKTS
jgi:hypothetical protein